jgi:hypothetical protein
MLAFVVAPSPKPFAVEAAAARVTWIWATPSTRQSPRFGLARRSYRRSITYLAPTLTVLAEVAVEAPSVSENFCDGWS